MPEAPGRRGRLVFAGTPEFAVPTLEALVAAGHAPLLVLTQPDRPVGRGRRLQAPPVKLAAGELGLPVLQPERLRASTLDVLAGLQPDLLVVIAYGLLLPPAVLQLPARGCVNLHASLLPRWRGAAPIQRAIAAGDRETGVCLMHMEAGLDTGPVYACRRTPIRDGESSATLHQRLAALSAELLVEQIDALLAGTLEHRPQSPRGVLHAPKLSKAEAVIDWALPAPVLARQVAAFNPWPVAETRWGARRLRVWEARALAADADTDPGVVVAVADDGLQVACGEGTLLLQVLQLEGAKPTPVEAFLRGHHLTPGERLG